MTLIDTFGSPENAYIAAGMLRSHGIECEVIENAGSELFPAPLGNPPTPLPTPLLLQK